MVLMTDFFHKSFELYFISLLCGISPHFVSIDDMYLFIYLFAYESEVFVTWSLLARERTLGHNDMIITT